MTALVRRSFLIIGLAAVIYGFLAGFRTLSEFDLGWQLATGRWIIEHGAIPSTDVFSYTAEGRPWIYPVGSSLLFYAAYLVGHDAILSWLAAIVCAGTIALTLRRGSAGTAILAILAVASIAIRIRPRADMFTTLLFAAFLSLLWQQHREARARLWLLPVLMAAWVNLHPGFIAGLALIPAYLLVEALELVAPERRAAVLDRMRRAWPWLLASLAATLANPWGWGIYRAVLRQEDAMAIQARWIPEWGPSQLNGTVLIEALSLRNPGGAFHLILLIAAVIVPVALLRRQWGAAILIAVAAFLAFQHIRLEALFGITLVIVGGSVLEGGLSALPARLKPPLLAAGIAIAILLLAGLRSLDLVTDRTYRASTDLGSFGAGQSWWFPDRAADFVLGQNLPGRIFNSYNLGGFLVWRLGERYPDYIDGRALPFGAELFARNRALMTTPPGAPAWAEEAERYDLDTVFVPLGRYSGLNLFPVLRQFCMSDSWRPVYLDEVAAVFVRRRPETESLIARLGLDCATAPLPAIADPVGSTGSFNQLANAAALLQALGREDEALEASARALALFADSAFLHFLRGTLFEERQDLATAEQEYRTATALEPNGTAWSRLGTIFHREGRLGEAIEAWQQAADLLPNPAPELLSLGYAELAGGHPRAAVAAFDRAAAMLPGSSPLAADLERGRARASQALGR